MKGGVKFYRGSAAGARSYVEAEHSRADDYYLTEGTGFAQRYEATAEGAVRPMAELDGDAYEAWVSGVDPDTGELRGRVRQDPNALRFCEVVVNGPKSWSLAAELHPDIAVAFEAAQDRAAQEIVRWAGQHATTRVGPRGAQVATPVQRIEAVSVRHYTNRAGDPHRHLHVQINARVQAAGKWRGIDSAAVRDSTKAIQGIGHATVVADPQFRAALAAHGLTLDEAGEVRQLAAYVGPFSQRAEQILRQIDGYEAQWRDANPDQQPGPALRRAWDARAWQEHRPGKGDPVPAEQARRQWVQELRRLGYTDPPGPADAGGQPPGRIDRDAAAAEVVARLGAAGSAWNHPDVRGQAEQLIARRLVIADPAARTELTEDITARAVALCRPLLDRSGVPEHVRALTSQHVLDVEADLTGRLAVRGALAGADADPVAIQAAAATAGRSLDGRQAAAAAALAGDRPLVVVQGAAGAGKTTTLGTARDALAEHGHAMVVVTPTLKAAKAAAAELGTPAGSAAALAWAHGWRWDDTGWRQLGPGDGDPTTGRTWAGPAHGAPALRPGDLLVVDEAGMLDQDTARALLSIADEHGARIALMGDAHQLAAIGRGGVLDMARRWTSSDTDLTVIHRFTRTAEIAPGIHGTAPDTEYAALTLRMRRRDDPASVFDRLEARGQVHLHDSPEQRDAAIAALAVADRRAGRPAAVVVDTLDQAARLNTAIRDRMIAAGMVDDTRTVTTAAGNRIGAGDVIAARSNDHGAGVANRDRWTVTAVTDDGRLQVTGDPGERTLSPGYVAEHVEPAYATTAYGVQGETTTASRLIMSEHTGAGSAYVAMTRGREANDVHLVADHRDDAQRQWADAFGRGRADLGTDGARTAAEAAATQYAGPSPNPAAAGQQLAALIEQIRGAWQDRETAQEQLRYLAPRVEAARDDAADIAEGERILSPLRDRAAGATAAAEAAQQQAAAAQQTIDRRAERIAALLRPQWDEDRPTAAEAARVMHQGPGRLSLNRGNVARARAWLEEWAANWEPVVGDLNSHPGGPAAYANRPPAADGIDTAIAGYAQRCARAELPRLAATVDAAPAAQDAAAAAAQDHRTAQEQITQRALNRRWTYGYGHTPAAQLPELTARAQQLGETIANSDNRLASLAADPLIAQRPDADHFIPDLANRWKISARIERSNLAARQAADESQRRTTDQRHALPHQPTPGPDRGGPDR